MPLARPPPKSVDPSWDSLMKDLEAQGVKPRPSDEAFIREFVRLAQTEGIDAANKTWLDDTQGPKLRPNGERSNEEFITTTPRIMNSNAPEAPDALVPKGKKTAQKERSAGDTSSIVPPIPKQTESQKVPRTKTQKKKKLLPGSGFQHITHLGWDGNEFTSTTQVDASWQAVMSALETQGVKPRPQDEEFIRSFVKEAMVEGSNEKADMDVAQHSSTQLAPSQLPPSATRSRVPPAPPIRSTQHGGTGLAPSQLSPSTTRSRATPTLPIRPTLHPPPPPKRQVSPAPFADRSPAPSPRPPPPNPPQRRVSPTPLHSPSPPRPATAQVADPNDESHSLTSLRTQAKQKPPPPPPPRRVAHGIEVIATPDTSTPPPANRLTPQSFNNSVSEREDISKYVSLLEGDPIGGGGFCDLFLGLHKTHGKVALKRPRVAYYDSSDIRRFLREADVWRRISHPNILPFLGTCTIRKNIYLVSPFLKNGDLFTCIQKGMNLDREKIILQVASAIMHLHSLDIVHGDIKAQNVLLSDDNTPCLCDFGMAKILSTMVTSTDGKGRGSTRWMAPELFDNEPKTVGSDVYAFGMTIAEVLSGKPPLSHIHDYAVVVQVLNKNARPLLQPSKSPHGKSYAKLWEVAASCWVTNVQDRPTMNHVLTSLAAECEKQI